MTKKRPPKQRAWNKGLEVGKRDGFTPDQVKRIWGLLASQQRAPVLQGTESRLTSEHAQDLEQVLGIVCGALAAPLHHATNPDIDLRKDRDRVRLPIPCPRCGKDDYGPDNQKPSKHASERPAQPHGC